MGKNIIYFPLKMKFASIALLGVAAATSKHNQVMLYNLMQLESEGAPACPPPLAITEDELNYQLGEFSRNFDNKNWDNAMEIKGKLAEAGSTPKFAVTTKELYDYAVQQMNELEHYEDNLNSNLSNKLALTRFVEVAKKVRANLNDKYDIGFIDPGVEGDW